MNATLSPRRCCLRLLFAAAFAAAGLPARSTHAQTAAVTVLHNFIGPANGTQPQANLIQATDGNFYGTTQFGGTDDEGTVFKVTPAGVLTTLYNFTGLSDGGQPQAGLIQGTDGNFYGTTDTSGPGTYGTVFQLTPAGVLTTLHVFTQVNDGGQPQAALAQGTDGNFYGTTSAYSKDSNGASYEGTIFQITPAGVLTTLHYFTGPDGSQPVAALVQGSDGTFYGTAEGGGSGYDGVVFSITPAGTFTKLYEFSYQNGDGTEPKGTLIKGTDGNFYGTTADGGQHSVGTAFQLTPAGVVTVFYSFTSSGQQGYFPYAGLLLGGDGNFYGTTSFGGTNNLGTVFQLTPAGVLTTLYSFTDANDGARPQAALALGTDGNLYGTTTGLGDTNRGTVFQITTAGALTTLAVFVNGTDGTRPQGALALGPDGNFYGLTLGGGVNDEGAVFEVTPAGGETVLHSFAFEVAGGNADGLEPQGMLALGFDGNLYGTVSYGGANGDGTIFQLTPAGVLTTLYNFDGTKGTVPAAGLTLGPDGNFYGTTEFAGAQGGGTVFKVTPAGVLTDLHDFTYAEGGQPQGALALGPDGNFYGTVTSGGAHNHGAIFRVTPAGGFTSLYSFNVSDGAQPRAGLALGPDGNFYGTTPTGGANGAGTVFQFSPAGALATFYNFGGTGGGNPQAGLALANDGSLYGTTTTGGTSGGGTLFKITTADALTTLHNFAAPDGLDALAALIPGMDGSLYGTTYQGGAYNVGTVYRVGLPQSSQTLQFAAPGYSVNENGGSVALVVPRTGGFGGPVFVHYATADGSARAGIDYAASSGILFWASGDTSAKTINVPVYDHGQTGGGMFTFSVTLSNPGGPAAVGSLATGTVTITENDPAPSNVVPAPTATAPGVITSLPCTIASGGAYVLNGNLASSQTGGNLITVNTSNVTINLQGHYIAGAVGNSAQTTTGIYANERSNVTVQNGTVAYCQTGVEIVGSGAANTNNVDQVLDNLRVTYCYGTGILVANAPSSRVTNCQVSQIGGGSTPMAAGIMVEGAGVTVQGNAVSNVSAATAGNAYCLSLDAGVFARANQVSGADFGINNGIYQGNEVHACTTAFSGGTDAGGNIHD